MNYDIQTRLAQLKSERELQSKEFPLAYLLRLYLQCPRHLCLYQFAGLKELITWLSPISRSDKQSKHIPTCLLSYEMQEIARLTGNHISQIYQELIEITSAGESK